jgi:hypothetical protein
MRAAIALAPVGLVTLLGACSFLTDFPDIEPLASGSGGSGGAGSSTSTGETTSTGLGGEGGGPPCTSCRTCYPDGAVCPETEPSASYVLTAPVSTPGPMARIAWVTDGAQLSGTDYALIGTFDTQLAMPGGPISANGTQQGGFVLRGGTAADAYRFGAATCAGGTAFNDEVFLNGVALTADGTLVVGGGFQGDRLAFFSSTLDCAAPPSFIDSPTDGDANIVPFVVWVNVETSNVIDALDPEIENQEENGYISDVAALAPADDADRVVAIGFANGNPFDATADAPGFGYYLVSADGPTGEIFLDPISVECTTLYDEFTIPGLRSGVAVDDAGVVWAAGAGCGTDRRSFLVKVPTSPDGTFGASVEAVFGDRDNPIAISKVAVSSAHVVVAGTYTGTPRAGWDVGVPGFEVGDEGDAFVMAFDRATWTNQVKPKWFRRIRSTSVHPMGLDDATVDALVVDSNRVSISGRIGSEGGIGAAYGCFTTPALGRGRAYVAQLAEDTGGVGWLRVDGYEVSGTTDRFARGTALVPLSGALISATSTHGEIVLECGGDSVGAGDAPLAHVRHFWLQ